MSTYKVKCLGMLKKFVMFKRNRQKKVFRNKKLCLIVVVIKISGIVYIV